MGILEDLFGTSKERKCSSCHRKIKGHEKAYLLHGKVYCEKCAEEEAFWDELDLLDDIFDDEEW